MVDLNMHPGASVAGNRDVEAAKDQIGGQEAASYSSANIRQSHSISMGRSSYTEARQRAASISGSETGPATTYPSESSITSTPPKTRKRLSINFALPVVSSSSAGGLAGQVSSGTSGATISSAVPRRNKPSHSHSASVSLPPLPNMMFGPLGSGSNGTVQARQSLTSSPNSTTSSPPIKHKNKHKHSASISHPPDLGSGASTPSNTSNNSINNSISNPSSKASAIEYYFSQLAYRERRVVELRDEIKRMELQLRQAEEDLVEFRKNVPAELMPGGVSSMSGGSPNSGLSRSNTYSANSATTISPPTATTGHTSEARSRPFSLDVASLPDESKKPMQLSNHDPNQQPLRSHSNSLSGSSVSSAEDIKHRLIGPSGTLGSGLPMPPSRSHHVMQPNPMYAHQGQQHMLDENGSDVYHKEQRTTEEPGKQFWAFFEDVKNAPGDESHNPMLMGHTGMPGHPMSGLPGLPLQPPSQQSQDAGLPNLALLQQQHQNQQIQGVRGTAMAPPRKPRRKLGQQQSTADSVSLPSLPLHPPPPMMGLPPVSAGTHQRRVSTSKRGPVLGNAGTHTN